MLEIEWIRALEILDSRGNPTLCVQLELNTGSVGWAQVPSGASTGTHEALELRDGDPGRYGGKGVRRAVANVEQVLAPAVVGRAVQDQAELDSILIPEKNQVGANATLGVSCAFARAIAESDRVPLWASLQTGADPEMPFPMVNIISGGLHAGGLIEVQDFLVIPNGFDSMAGSLEAVVGIHRRTKEVLASKGYVVNGVADEGGWGPALQRNEDALGVLTEAIGDRASIAIDVAASHFYENGLYHLRSEGRVLDRRQMIDLLESWVDRYPVVSIEDGLHEDDWEGWVELTERLGSRVQLIGDDLFTTNPERLERGIGMGAANSVLVKMNQIGTLTETFEVLHMALQADYRAVISARSGETEDSFLADLAVASGAGQIKVGSVTRSERLAKYNRLLEIEGWEFS